MAKPADRVREIIANATAVSSLPSEALASTVALAPAEQHSSTSSVEPDGYDAPPPWDGVEDGAEPSDMRQDGVDLNVVAECSKLDQSDTDNGTRLLAHFGRDVPVPEPEGAASAAYLASDGKHWNGASGNDASIRLAQKIGGRIALEADHLSLTPAERALQDRASRLKALNPKDLSDEDKQIITDAKEALKALAGRKRQRRQFGVTSKNQGRISNMLSMAAPHITRKADDFNFDPMLVATRNCTLRFSQTRHPSATAAMRVAQVKALTGSSEPFKPGDYETTAHMDPTPGHERGDLITKLMPVDYDPEALCPLWDAFLGEYLPDPDVRRMVQVFSGLGMTGIGLQRVMFHYGSGANGKSAFMETLMRIMGPLGVGLPAASLVGESKSTGNQANPDIARLYSARCVRVAELPPNEPVKEELVKVLTGGERMPARNLFKGFFEFTPVFKAHLSGNGLPRIDGTDNGIWRRMVVVPWVKTIPEEKRRDLHIVVSEFMAEASGILNWLVEGVMIFLREGFIVPEAARAATQDYRDEMDPIGQFVAACVKASPGNKVQASTMYTAYETWCLANGKAPFKQNMFGRKMGGKVDRDTSGSVHFYTNCVLHSVPERPQTPFNDR